MRRIDMTGMRYDRLVVINFVDTKYKKARWRCVCDCSKEVIVYGENLRRGRTHSCGCLNMDSKRSRSGINSPVWGLRGELSPSWQGGLTSENQRIRTSTEYAQWRTSCFIRDNYTCQNCGKVGGLLHSHHIENFSNHKSLRLELANSVTMCKNCHKKFHKMYGNKNNNKMQVVDFTKSFYCQL